MVHLDVVPRIEVHVASSLAYQIEVFLIEEEFVGPDLLSGSQVFLEIREVVSHWLVLSLLRLLAVLFMVVELHHTLSLLIN